MYRKSAFAKIGANYTDSMWALATASIPEEKVTKVSFIGSNRLGRFSNWPIDQSNGGICQPIGKRELI